jgi:trigger factor
MSIFAAALDNEVEVKEQGKKGCTVTIAVTSQASLVNKCFNNALLQVQAKAQMQGFRAGKVPLDLVKKNFSAHIQERAIDLLVRNASEKALEKSKLNPVMIPSVSKADFAAFKENATFTFELSLDVAPEFTPKGYTGIEITKKADTVSQADVDKRLEDILEHNSSLENDVEGATVTDTSFAVVKYSGSKDGVADKKYSNDGELIDMSAPQTIEGLAEAIKGAKKGDTKEFEVKMDDGTVKFTAQVEEIKKKVKPELNASFAKDMGFESVEKLKEVLKSSMENEAKTHSERDITAQIEDALVKANTFDLPASLVEYQTEIAVDNFIHRMFGGSQTPANFTAENKKAFAEKMRPTVEKDLKVGYIISAIAKKENIASTDAEWQAELDKALVANPKDEKRVKDFFNQKKADILASLDERKVFDFLKAKANIK